MKVDHWLFCGKWIRRQGWKQDQYDAILLVQGRAGISLDNLAWLWDNDDKHEYLHSIYYVPGLVQNTFKILISHNNPMS